MSLKAFDAVSTRVDVAVDVRRGCVLVPPAPRGAEVRSRVVDPGADLLAIVDALASGHHTVGLVLASGERRCDAVREEDERVICPLITAQAVRAERHVIVRVDVEDAWEHVLVVAQLNDARTLCLLGGDRAIHGKQASGDNEYSLIADDGVARRREKPAAANDDGILAKRVDPRGVLGRILRRCIRRHGGDDNEGSKRATYR